MSQLPSELAGELSRLESAFNIDQVKLKKITDRFIEELEDGLKENGSNIPMNVTWVRGLPTGKERGSFLTLDMGGTNLRLCKVVLSDEDGKHELTQEQYTLPEEIKTGSADELWNYVTESLEKFLEDQKLSRNEEHSLAFCFSYPASQDRIDHGVLQTWTKGLDIKGVEGNDVAEQLRAALKKKVCDYEIVRFNSISPAVQNLPLKLLVLANDTTGALMASAYTDPTTIIGAVFGTGCNAAYVEDCSAVTKLKDLQPDGQMAINCEYGAFDNSKKVLPRTVYDEQIDEESPRPGEQTFEKMSAGHYLGEIFRLVLVELHEKELVFKGQDSSKLKETYILDTGVLSAVENDSSSRLSDTRKLFQETLNIDPTEAEMEFSHRLAEIIAIRGARLSACGVAAICKKKGIRKGHVAADGSVVNKHPHFLQRWTEALGEILEWPESERRSLDDDGAGPIRLTSAEDGSGVGVAVIAAMTLDGRGKA